MRLKLKPALQNQLFFEEPVLYIIMMKSSGGAQKPYGPVL